MSFPVDIIIPVLNEEKILTKRGEYFRLLGTCGNLIFVDGGSADRTAQVAAGYGKIVRSPAGRGVQKNAGAAQAAGDLFLFLNVDTEIEMSSLERISVFLKSHPEGAGCLTMAIDDPRRIFRGYESIVNWRAKRWGVVDADLGFFIHRQSFDRVGGFDRLPYMEDIAISRKLRRSVKAVQLEDVIKVSSRKWDEKGFGRTLFGYSWAYVKYLMGMM